MQSRMEKYYQDSNKQISRTEKHINSYKELYGSNLDSYDVLPVSSNVNVIDADTLKKLATRDEYKRQKQNKEEDDFWSDNIPKGFEENKIYDINELIKKAREEKNSIVKDVGKLTNYSYLAKLEDKNSKDTIEEEIKKELEKLDMEIENVKKDINPDLDLLSDLKGSDNTITIKPMKEEITTSLPTNTKLEKEFYSGALKIEKDDFTLDDETNEQEKSSIWFKITVIVLTTIAVVLAVIYTIKNI